MSDPGITYRTREEIQDVRKHKDPIIRLKGRIIESNIATEDDMKKIDKDIKEQVEAAVKFSEQSPLPPKEELVTDVYVDKHYVVKGRHAKEIYTVNNQ
jgi:pyruvate dehydrogenase E1 component alpha subunit